MALLSCAECGKEVSAKSKICVNCGAPFDGQILRKQLRAKFLESMTHEEMQNHKHYEVKASSKRQKHALVLALFAVIIAAFMFVSNWYSSINRIPHEIDRSYLGRATYEADKFLSRLDMSAYERAQGASRNAIIISRSELDRCRIIQKAHREALKLKKTKDIQAWQNRWNKRQCRKLIR